MMILAMFLTLLGSLCGLIGAIVYAAVKQVEIDEQALAREAQQATEEARHTESLHNETLPQEPQTSQTEATEPELPE